MFTKKIIILIFVAIINSSLAQIPNTITETEKLYGLSKFWQEVNYNFVYLDRRDREKWEKLYLEMIQDVQNTQNDYEYYKLLQKFCAVLEDGHTNIYMPDDIEIHQTYFGDYRLWVENIDDKAIITRVNYSKKDIIPIGTEIIKVNGLATQNYIEQKVKPYIASSTTHVLEDWAVSRMFRSPVGTTYNVEFKLPDGSIKNLKLTHKEVEEEKVYPEFEESQLMEFEWLENQIAYVALNSFGDENLLDQFQNILPELNKSKKLIIDLRNNGGGNTSIARPIFKHFTADSLFYGSKSRSRLHIPAYKAWGKSISKGDTLNSDFAKQAYLTYRDSYYHEFSRSPYSVEENLKNIVVPTVILIDHFTASAAEDFLIFTADQEHMTLIGRPTFGSTGQPLFFDLPGGGRARICTKEDTYPNGKKFVGVGIQPDIVVSRTLEDFLNKKDPALDRAVDYLKRK
jgi:C-terminal processing protease CtpA/Prc